MRILSTTTSSPSTAPHRGVRSHRWFALQQRRTMALVGGVALVLASCGSDDSSSNDVTEVDTTEPSATQDDGAVDESDDVAGDTGADDAVADTTAAVPVDELNASVLASWDDQARVEGLVVTDRDALVLQIDGFDTTIVAIDMDSGEMRTNPDAGRITDLVQTATNGVFAFDFDECSYRPLDPDDLSLGESVGELGGAGCSSGGDAVLVRGDMIWTVQPDAIYTIDTGNGETRSLSPSSISDRFADDDTPSGALLDLGDAVLVTYFVSGDDDLDAFAARIDDDLDAGPLVQVPRLPRFDNGVLVDDATDEDGFPLVVVLDPLTLEVTEDVPPQPPMWGTVSCDPVDSLRSLSGPDGSVWVGPIEADGEVVVARCLDGTEVARGQVDHDQFLDAHATEDGFSYLATVRADPDDDGMASLEALGTVLVHVATP